MGRLLLSVAVLAGVALTACSSHSAGAPHVAVTPQRCPGTAFTGDADGGGPGRANTPAVGTAARGPARLHAVAAPAGAIAPAWSRDGRWLAFIVAPPSPYPVVSTPSGT